MNTAPDLLQRIRSGVIGERDAIPTPFGERPLIYADYTASGRALDFIEDAIREAVLPLYANTHSEASYTGQQIGGLREQAREAIRSAVGAQDDYAVIFCGSGATAAINKLLDILRLRAQAEPGGCQVWAGSPAEDERPVVFVGPYEHHSNELPWRESLATVVRIGLTGNGDIDTADLERKLCEFGGHRLKIGSFSAASNVTGIRTDVDTISEILNRHGALACWDYAAAAPYLGIQMHGDDESRRKHAVFFSPHKFVGGPGTPGVLVVHRSLLTNRVPAVPGGGTVQFVSPDTHHYLDDAERREEGGTPAIVESIRAGLIVLLQLRVGPERIEVLEQGLIRRAIKRWQSSPNIAILGETQAERLSIISFQVLHQGRPLHFGFVTALLNDLFGIQARGGCSCAGPYGHWLLDLSPDTSRELEAAVVAGHTIFRPGWCRLNFNYFLDDETFEYILSAVELVAEHGWRLLNAYRFQPETGIWAYAHAPRPPCATLEQLLDRQDRPHKYVGRLGDCLEQAKSIMRNAEMTRASLNDPLPGEFRHLQWWCASPASQHVT